MIIVIQNCSDCMYSFKWTSQSAIGTMPIGNLMLSGSILLSGSLVAKTLRFLDLMNIAHQHTSRVYSHQKKYVFPIVFRIWETEKQSLVTALKNKGGKVSLAGDGRSDSPGFSAKYGTYTFLECSTNKILDIQTVQSNEVSSSNACELEGLKRGILAIENEGLAIEEMVTDRHLGIKKYMRTQRPEVKHYFDTWHVAKGLGKKINSLAQQKEMDKVSAWHKTIINHLHWCSSSTPDGNGDVMVAKWESLTRHICNLHTGHGELYPNCLHEELTEHCGQKQWFTTASNAYIKLCDLLQAKALLTDVRKLSPNYQTYHLEAFHNLLLDFIPKHTAFSYIGMRARALIAAMHFNENSEKSHIVDSSGKPKFSIIYPKAKKGEYSIKRRKEASSYGYTQIMMKELVNVFSKDSKGLENSLYEFVQEVPPSLAASCERPSVEDLTKLFSRYEHPTN